MTTTTLPGPMAGPSDEAPRAPRLPGTWTVTWHGVRTVAALELRQRVRSTRWIVALVVWFVVVGAITLLVWLAVKETLSWDSAAQQLQGPLLFGVVVFFVLFLGLLVAPTLSATSINGDRAAGTLATLQVTMLSPAEIVLGKLLASWLAALAFLAASVPFLGASLLAGGTPVLAMIVCLAVLAALLAAVCAIGLGFSALTARTSGSAVLTYLAVATLSALSPILFVLTLTSTSSEQTVQVWSVAPSSTDVRGTDVTLEEPCVWRTEKRTVTHTERTWWLLGINPFVIVADAAPRPDLGPDTVLAGGDPLGAIRDGVRTLRMGPETEFDNCWTRQGVLGETYESPVAERDVDDSVVWPWGLGANLLLGVAGLVVAVRRLRIPQRTLARGTRVA